ncbi:beta-carotene hydroxylase [Salix suchowensis]|nr:beta-carotene hydroxylase [Salix suchowensis]
MACTASISMAPSSVTPRFRQSFLLAHKPSSLIISAHFKPKGFEYRREKENLNSCLVVEKRAEDSTEQQKKPERYTYLVAAILSSVGITSMAAMAVHYRFLWKMEGGVVPLLEMFGTFAGGMEFWARWAHRALWHASLWHMHESHHRPRNVPFELNDVFAIINAVPAIALFSYGFFNEGLLPGLCFGAIPVGPVANVPYLRRVAAAHQLHYADKFDGAPYQRSNFCDNYQGILPLDKYIKKKCNQLECYTEH